MDPVSPTIFQSTLAPSRHRQVVWSLLGTFLALIGLGFWLFFRDDPAPDTSDLLPRWSRSQHPDNPLARFCTAGAHSLPFWGPRNKMTIAEFEQNPHSAFPHFTNLINSPIDTWAWSDAESMLTWFQTDPVDIPLRTFRDYLETKNELALTEDRREDALNYAAQLLKLGTGTAKAESGLIRLDLAASLYCAGLKALRTTVHQSNTPVSLLRKAQETLNQYPGPSPKDYGFSCRFTHLFAIKLLDVAKKQGGEFLMQETPYPSSRVPLLKRAIKPNRTLQWRASHTREILAALDQGGALQAYLCGQQQIAALQPWVARSHHWTFLADGNYAGKQFHIGWTTSNQTFLSTVMASTAIRHAIQIELALRLYQSEHNRLPDTLNDLVPAYLSSIPLDPFSDAPMRWHKAKRVIYSLGTDLIDNDGDVKPFTYLHELKNHPDFGVTYWWSTSMETP